MKLKLVIFDYDGLLVDSERLAFIAEKRVLAKYGKPLTKELFEKYSGYSVADTIAGYISHYNLPVSFEEFLSERESILANLIKTNLNLMPGARVLIEFLKNKNILIAVASSGNSDYIKQGLRKFGLLNSFKNITCVDEVKRGKPHPDLFLLALLKNNVKHDEAIIIEDSVSGIKAAKNAHIFCIAIPQHNTDMRQYGEADMIVNSLEKVKHIFEQLIR